jgi:hypothetical protein
LGLTPEALILQVLTVEWRTAAKTFDQSRGEADVPAKDQSALQGRNDGVQLSFQDSDEIFFGVDIPDGVHGRLIGVLFEVHGAVADIDDRTRSPSDFQPKAADESLQARDEFRNIRPIGAKWRLVLRLGVHFASSDQPTGHTNSRLDEALSSLTEGRVQSST